MSTDVIIPPYCEMVVPVQVEAPRSMEPHTDFYIGYVEPETRDSMGLVVARTVAPVKDGLTVARLLNPTDHELRMHSGSHLGVLHHVDNSDVFEPTDGVDPDAKPVTLPDLGDCYLTDDQRQELSELLERHCNVFRTGGGFTKATGVIKHHINTNGSLPVRKRAYRTSPDKRREIDRQVQRLLADGIFMVSSETQTMDMSTSVAVCGVEASTEAPLSAQASDSCEPSVPPDGSDLQTLFQEGSNRRKAPVPHHRAPMRTTLAQRPFQRVAADILELPATSRGNRYVLVVEDYFTKRLDAAFRQSRNNSVTASDKQRTFYDNRERHRPYEIGDLVWLHDPTESRRKLAPHWKGPYIIERRQDRDDVVGVTYVIGSPFGDEAPKQTIHYD
uniref:Integrase catalytic domain-containing protein n=1 Tax=Knipowitschia caucasica TaxID=637954 RepID=A0AAV2KZB8_KNICA